MSAAGVKGPCMAASTGSAHISPAMGSTDTNREEALMAVVSTPRTC